MPVREGEFEMNVPQFLAALQELFDVSAGTIHKDSVLQDIAGWNSMTFIGLIAMLDEEFGVRIPPGTILRCHSVEDLMDEVSAELGSSKMAA
jgi:acyl carrier protein